MSASPKSRDSDVAETTLTELELESIEYFISFVQMLGLPKSIGEIYGLLFVATEPVSLDGFVERLRISKGSASQGLAMLRNLGAVQRVYVAGDRRDHYKPDFHVARIAKNFFQEKMEPRLDSGFERLDRMEALAMEVGEEQAAAPLSRIRAMRSWQRRGQKLLPWILKLLKK